MRSLSSLQRFFAQQQEEEKYSQPRFWAPTKGPALQGRSSLCRNSQPRALSWALGYKTATKHHLKPYMGGLYGISVPKTQRLSGKFTCIWHLTPQLIGEAVVEECKKVFDGVQSLVDVERGTGTISKAIMRKFPHWTPRFPHIVGGLQRTENLNFFMFFSMQEKCWKLL